MTDINKIEFTAPKVTEDEINEYHFEGTGTTVLAFFPGAFTKVCTKEMCRFRDMMNKLDDLGSEVLGISVDSPFSLDEFRSQNDLNFPLISDNNKEIIDQYGVRTDFMDIGYNGLAKRAVIIVKDKEVVYEEVMEDPSEMPDIEKLRTKLEEIRQ
jgi:peroxiredoxin